MFQKFRKAATRLIVEAVTQNLAFSPSSRLIGRRGNENANTMNDISNVIRVASSQRMYPNFPDLPKARLNVPQPIRRCDGGNSGGVGDGDAVVAAVADNKRSESNAAAVAANAAATATAATTTPTATTAAAAAAAAKEATKTTTPKTKSKPKITATHAAQLQQQQQNSTLLDGVVDNTQPPPLMPKPLQPPPRPPPPQLIRHNNATTSTTSTFTSSPLNYNNNPRHHYSYQHNRSHQQQHHHHQNWLYDQHTRKSNRSLPFVKLKPSNSPATRADSTYPQSFMRKINAQVACNAAHIQSAAAAAVSAPALHAKSPAQLKWPPLRQKSTKKLYSNSQPMSDRKRNNSAELESPQELNLRNCVSHFPIRKGISPFVNIKITTPYTIVMPPQKSSKHANQKSSKRSEPPASRSEQINLLARPKVDTNQTKRLQEFLSCSKLLLNSDYDDVDGDDNGNVNGDRVAKAPAPTPTPQLPPLFPPLQPDNRKPIPTRRLKGC